MRILTLHQAKLKHVNSTPIVSCEPKSAVWLCFLKAIVCGSLISLLTSCDPGRPPDPGSVAKAIVDQKAEVPLVPETSTAERLAFTAVKWKSTSRSDGKTLIDVWSDVIRKSEKDEKLRFELNLTLHFKDRLESFTESLDNTRLNLNKLTKVKGDVPIKITVSIGSEKATDSR